MTEGIAIVSACVAVMAVYFAAKAAAASHRSAGAAEESVQIAKKSSEAATRSADAAEKANLLTNDELLRQRRTKLVVEGWSGKGGLVVTNPGPGTARDLLVVLAYPRRQASFASVRAHHQEVLRLRQTNGWPAGFAPGSEPPERASPGDVAFVEWTNDDDTRDETGWVQAPNIDD